MMQSEAVPGTCLVAPQADETPDAMALRPSAPPPSRFHGVLIDAHLRGTSSWPVVDQILECIGQSARGLTVAEVLATLTEPGGAIAMGLLLKRGVLVERQAGKKAVLVTVTHSAA